MALQGAPAAPVFPEFSVEGEGIRFHGGRPAVVLVERAGGEEKAELMESVAASVVEEGPRQTPSGPGKKKVFRWDDAGGHTATWTLTTLDDGSGVTVQMTFSNGSKKPVHLREFLLSRSGNSPGVRVDGKAVDWWLSTMDSHNFPRGGFLPSRNLAQPGKVNFCDVLTAYTDHEKRGLFLGAAGPAESDVFFRGNVLDGGLGLEIASEMTDVLVDPGETRCSEEVLMISRPYEAAIDCWMRWIAATHGTRTSRGPLFGWCSWYDVGPNVTASQVKQVAATVAAKRDLIPMQVIQIDDGWQKAYGDWRADKTKFPEGMKPVAEAIRKAGAIPGIWLCMVRTSENGAHPDGTRSPKGGKKPEFIDSTHPEVRRFIRENLAARVAEGFRYFKLDFNGVRTEGRFDQKKTRLQIHRDLFKLYRECIGEGSYLLACVGGPTRGPIGFADAQRIGTDSNPKWGKLYTGCCILDCINAVGSTAPANGVLFVSDPDVSYVLPRGQLSSDEVRTWQGFVGLLGGLALVSEPIQKEKYGTSRSLRTLEIMNPPSPDRGRSFNAAVDPLHRQFGFVAERPWGNFASVLLWNPGEEPADVSLTGVPLESLGEKFHVWSFWDGQYLGVGDREFAANAIPKHASVLLRLTPLSMDGPVLIGSTLHISMGAAEIKGIKSTDETITVELSDAGARDGDLLFFSTKPLKLTGSAGCNAKLSRAGEKLWKVALSGRRRWEPNVIRLSVASRS